MQWMCCIAVQTASTLFIGQPAEEVPLREETIPIHDITITLKGYAVKRVHLEPQSRDLETKKALFASFRASLAKSRA